MIEETSSSDQVQMDILIQMYRTQRPPAKFSNETGVEDKKSISAHERIQPENARHNQR